MMVSATRPVSILAFLLAGLAPGLAPVPSHGDPVLGDLTVKVVVSDVSYVHGDVGAEWRWEFDLEAASGSVGHGEMSEILNTGESRKFNRTVIAANVGSCIPTEGQAVGNLGKRVLTLKITATEDDWIDDDIGTATTAVTVACPSSAAFYNVSVPVRANDTDETDAVLLFGIAVAAFCNGGPILATPCPDLSAVGEK